MSNVGTQDITGIKGKLSLPAPYQSPSGRGVAMMADNDQKASAGNTFALTFFVDVSDKAPIKDYSGTIDLTFQDYVNLVSEVKTLLLHSNLLAIV